MPIFVGRTNADEKIVLYKEVHPFEDSPALLHQPPTELPPREIHYLRRPDGELWAIEEGARVCIQHGFEDHRVQLQVRCQAWQGTAMGSRAELEEEGLLEI